MQFAREINRLLLGMFIAFAVVGIAAGYWAIAGADTILLREDNPRLVLAEASIRRGDLVDRQGDVLAESIVNEDGVVIRQYPHEATYSALGYFSLRYGVGGAEAAYDALLRGDTLTPTFDETLFDSLLHRPQEGSDVRLTLDLDVQRAVAEAMRGRRGAAVVLAVPSGDVLAMVSSPTYDPNTLDTQWNELREAPGNPFFNRVLQGRYQPGTALQTPLMAAALLYDQPLDEPQELATRPIQVDGIEMSCAVRLPDLLLTLREAYAFACPYPFANLASAIGADALDTVYDSFYLDAMPELPGFVANNADATPEAQLPEPLDDGNLVESALGQAGLTVNPLGMAALAAAIVNDGNAPPPNAILETRAPGDDSWQLVQSRRPTVPVATVNTARQLQDLMRYSVANGAAQNAGRPNIDIGGHVGIAYSGEGPLAWFTGFATLGGRQGIAVAVVLENTDDSGLAADIGGTALAAAHQELQQNADS